uniref:Translocation transactivator n=1 Tax=Solanum tuberosum TaxID=4113 RepID=M1BMP0_SOLTU
MTLLGTNMTLLCTKVDSLEKELQQMKSQQHDYKHAELGRQEDLKIPELEGDDGKHRKTQTNSLLHAVTGSTSSTKEEKNMLIQI